MNTQEERSRQDEDNQSDRRTDVSRSQNRQGANEANEGRNISNDPLRPGAGHEGSDEAGTHREGTYDKTGRGRDLDTEGSGNR